MLVYIICAIMCFAMGFANESRGTIFTESVKTKITVATFAMCTSSIIYSILSKWYWGIALVILIYIFVSGLGALFLHLLKKK